MKMKDIEKLEKSFNRTLKEWQEREQLNTGEALGIAISAIGKTIGNHANDFPNMCEGVNRYTQLFMSAAVFAQDIKQKAPPLKKKNYWVSWYEPIDATTFVTRKFASLWVTGTTGDGTRRTICMAIQAHSEEDIWEFVQYARGKVEKRFCNEQRDDWSPYSDRFPQGDNPPWPKL